ncbi:MAG: 16S rRNA (guanine(527)-N(7))-methyltransferase RsmG [Proteobacteria bacterium]|nr:16S rRNA (guanine(527)-N(7))-methyltransferase RsmG [Pseudomonadota bacterium]
MSDFKRVFAKLDQEVSRETFGKLQAYYKLLLKWQKAINLVSHATMDEAVTRHFLDSAQLIKYIPNKDIVLADMGSGAGFPGLVLAIMGVKEVHLIESDVRKATFLRTVVRELELPVTIHNERIGAVSIPNVDLITARALSALVDLFPKVKQIATEGHNVKCLFPKGERTEIEITKARKKWEFDVNLHQSITDKAGKILEISNIKAK